MELIEKYRWPVFFAVAVILLVVLIVASGNNNVNNTTSKSKVATASEQKKAQEMVKQEEAKAKDDAAKTGNVTYTARLGDSYTVLARKAVEAYVSATGTKFSHAQIVAAETHLTIDAGSPALNYGQKVTLSKATVAKAVSAAQKLSAAQLAAWQTYVPSVNFDTTQNG